ncbi:hypothetical protein [Ruegeria sp. HKCCA5426]|uniref:hypothetical protein n=1 Tax=Ruegeria sp. HKCCA5426 TaxID=2682985 RepID=UPI001488F3A3|nr:hypothetical protein [Ruegeria sp. HKCCA5426]
MHDCSVALGSTVAKPDFISERLGLRNGPSIQDWEFEVVDSTDLGVYLKLFDEMSGREDIRFTLADMIIQAFDESGLDLKTNPEWQEFLKTLSREIDIHASQIWYWANWEVQLEDAWDVTPYMRSLCQTHFASET